MAMKFFKMAWPEWGLQNALGRGNHAFAAGIELDGHAQGAAERLEDGLTLVVRVFALEVVDVQRGQGMVAEALEEFAREVDVEAPDVRTGVGDVVEQAGAAREVDDDPRERFVERHVGIDRKSTRLNS